MRAISRPLSKDAGELAQATTEYILVLSVVVLSSMFSLMLFSDSLISLIFRAGKSVESEVSTDELKGDAGKGRQQRQGKKGEVKAQASTPPKPMTLREKVIARYQSEYSKIRTDPKQYKEALWKYRAESVKVYFLYALGFAIIALLMVITYMRMKILIRQAR